MRRRSASPCPEPGDYGVGHLFMPRDPEGCRARRGDRRARRSRTRACVFLGWRDVPVDNADLGESVKATEPLHRQIFVGRGKGMEDEDDFERRLFIARKVDLERGLRPARTARTAGYYPVSLSSRTIVYKGMVLVHAARRLLSRTCRTRASRARSPSCTSASRPTPSRPGSSPIPTGWSPITARSTRCAATSTGWRRGRPRVDSELFGNDISKLWPISYEGQSDTACFDNALEFLVRGGYSLAHAMMMLIPEAWAGNPLMDEERRAFYEYHAALMEPWDGPAAIAFTDGRQIGATLDRNGLRPARYLVTDDGLVVLASEMGVLPIPEEKIVEKWRLQPGKMLLIDLEQGRIVSDDEIKHELATAPSLQGLARSARRSCSRTCSPVAGARSRAPTCRCSIASRPSATRRKT